MPVYEYKCKNCGEETTKIQKMSDESLKICPHCQLPELEKVLGTPAFKLVGGGFYKEGTH